MNSIRWTLLRAALLTIAILSFTSIGFFIMHLIVVEKYRSISDNMIGEYRLMDLTSNLINAYNDRFRNGSIEDPQVEKNITEINDQLKSLMSGLDQTIVNKDSQISYIGLKNTISSVTHELDDGLVILRSGNITGVSSYYDSANEDYIFVKENGAQLILNELKYANTIQDRLNLLYKVTASTGIIILLVTSLGCIVYMVTFSKKIVTPIGQLKEFAEQIAQGKMNVSIDSSLLNRTDEIGSLSRSYNIMVVKLVDIIAKLDDTNQKMTEASKKIATSYEEVEKMNKFMVGRELRMKELKLLNEELQKKLQTFESTSVN